MDLRNLYAAFATAHWVKPTNTMVPAKGDYGSIDNSNNCEQHVLQIRPHVATTHEVSRVTSCELHLGDLRVIQSTLVRENT